MTQGKKYSFTCTFRRSLEPSTQMDFFCQSSDESHCKPECSQLDVGDVVSNLFESNAAGISNFSFEGHCTMTNAEVQKNVITAKKGKKRGIKIQNSDSCCFTGKVIKYVGGI